MNVLLHAKQARAPAGARAPSRTRSRPARAGAPRSRPRSAGSRPRRPRPSGPPGAQQQAAAGSAAAEAAASGRHAARRARRSARRAAGRSRTRSCCASQAARTCTPNSAGASGYYQIMPEHLEAVRRHRTGRLPGEQGRAGRGREPDLERRRRRVELGLRRDRRHPLTGRPPAGHNLRAVSRAVKGGLVAAILIGALALRVAEVQRHLLPPAQRRRLVPDAGEPDRPHRRLLAEAQPGLGRRRHARPDRLLRARLPVLPGAGRPHRRPRDAARRRDPSRPDRPGGARDDHGGADRAGRARAVRRDRRPDRAGARRGLPGADRAVGTLVAENLLTVFVLAAVYAGAAGPPGARSARTRVRVDRRRRRAHRAGDAHPRERRSCSLIPLIPAVWTGPAAPRRPRSLAAPALLLATTALTILPWTIRNAVVMHRFIPVSDETGITLVGTYNPASAADPDGALQVADLLRHPGRARADPRGPLHDRAAARREARAPGAPLHRGPPVLARSWSRSTTPCGCSSSRARSPGSASAAAISLPTSTARVGVFSFWIAVPARARRRVHPAGPERAEMGLGRAAAARAQRGARQRRDAALPRAGRPVPDPAGGGGAGDRGGGSRGG